MIDPKNLEDHQALIEAEVANALVHLCLTPYQAQAVVDAIAKGAIPHLRILY